MSVFVCKATDQRHPVIAHYSRSFGVLPCLASVSSRRRLFFPDPSMLAEATEGTGVDSV
jgi:hypothetical protein